MLMVRRKVGRWIHCINDATGQPISLQVHEVKRVGRAIQVTLAVHDDNHHYTVLKAGDREHRMLEPGEPIEPPPE
jgi:hypothetical protein